MVDLMSGINAPVARALEWCGWSVLPLDISISTQHDLHNQELQAHLLEIVGKVDMWMVGMDCGTFSRARERPIPGHPNPPKPLRDARHPEGLPTLAPREKERVNMANNLVTFFCRLLTAAHNAGAAGALENPLRAWIWALPEVQALLELPWSDFDYAACSLGGARAKAQRIRANIDELKAIRCTCHHVHAKDEWKPRWDDQANTWVYPSSEEQEYTADLAFNIAVATSAWACRMGRATLRLPRAPRPCETGSRVEWLAFPPSTMRLHAMPALAARMGLENPGSLAAMLPVLVRTQDVEQAPEGSVYIGEGNHKLRLARTQWASPFKPGPHGSPAGCVRKYTSWLLEQPQLLGQLAKLHGRKLLCDCPPQEPCHGEALVAAVYARSSQSSSKPQGNQPHQQPLSRTAATGATTSTPPRTGSNTVAILEPRPKQPGDRALPPDTKMRGAARRPGARATLVAAAALRAAAADARAVPHIPKPVALRWGQPSMDAALRGLFPSGWTQGFRMPNLEDIVNVAPFTCFADWLEANDISLSEGSSWANSAGPGWRAAALGQQRGALHSAAQIEPLVGFGLSKAEHLARAQDLARRGKSPWTEIAAADNDLRFAAADLLANRNRLREHRQATRKAFSELADRCAPLTTQLRQFQPPSVKRIAGNVNLGLVAVLVILMAWPDWKLPQRFVEGFQVVGELELSHVWEPQALPPPLPKPDLLAASRRLIASVEAERPQEEIAFIWDSCLKEQAKGFAGEPLPRAAFDKRYGIGGWSPVPAFCIEQSCGKKRRIDNGKRGGQNNATAYSEKARMCSAFQPGLHARLVREEAVALGIDVAREELHLETGGEDLPDAFRSIPCRPEDLDINIVAARCPDNNVMMYQQVEAMLFGFSSAVVGFGRWSRFLESLGRRVLALLWSMYVDDGNLTDGDVARGTGQQLIGYAFRRLGTPFADAKRSPMQALGSFLGVDHDMSKAITHGTVTFEPAARLLTKAVAQLDSMVETDLCTPAMASKFRGTAGFCAHAFWGRVGRAGFGPFRQRQYSDAEPWALSHSMRRSIDYFRLIMSVKPKRVMDCAAAKKPLVIIASDAQADPGTAPGCGYMLFDAATGRKTAGCNSMAESLLEVWGYSKEVRQQGGNPIAICEAAVIAATAYAEAPSLSGADVLWFVDNTTALHAFVKGTSANAEVERAAHVVHFLAYRHNIRIWFEFVDSEANWSDGVSRNLGSDSFARENNFEVSTLSVPEELWTSDLVDLWADLAA